MHPRTRTALTSPHPHRPDCGLLAHAPPPCLLQVVAVMPFSDPTTERTVRGFARLLRQNIERDGLTVASGVPEEEFRLAQFDALNSLGARRSEVWWELEDHPW